MSVQTAPPHSLLASQVYAASAGVTLDGPDQCHWCSAPCNRDWAYVDPPHVPFVTYTTPALRPGNGYVCRACWLWQRPRVTVAFLGGGYKDGQCHQTHSWWVTPRGAWSVRLDNPQCREALWRALLDPPGRFFLSLLEGNSHLNHLQQCIANAHHEVRGDSLLRMTANGVPYPFTVYELEQTAEHGGDGVGMNSGVRKLLELIGPPQPDQEKRKVGRPRKEEPVNPTRKLVRQSG